MDSFLQFFVFCSLLSLACSTRTNPSCHPKAVILPVFKDQSTLQYVTEIKQRTPLVPVNLTIDLGGQFMWVDCEEGYVSSSYVPVECGSKLCRDARSSSCRVECMTTPRPGCTDNTCSLIPLNNVAGTRGDFSDFGQDVLSIQSTNGRNLGQEKVVQKFPFTCGETFLLEGLASSVKGVAGLGWTNISIAPQFKKTLKVGNNFSVCLSASTTSKGFIIIGDVDPIFLLPNVDVTQSLIFTPLIQNPVSNTPVHFLDEPSPDYFINVTSITINGNSVPINTSLLTIDEQGFGGTKISTVNPYTIMETSIFNAFVQSFVHELENITRVESVPPFGACFRSNEIGSTRVGPGVPSIDLVLHGNDVIWRIFGANSMVQVNEEVLCLAFVDGGMRPSTSIIIGGHQIEDNLLQFDVAKRKLGFTSSLLFRQTTCANFNFTSTA